MFLTQNKQKIRWQKGKEILTSINLLVFSSNK